MSPVLKHSVTKDTDEIDIGRIIGELIDHRKLIISVTALFTVLALVYALFATPIYKADALVQVEQKQGNAILSNLSQMIPNSQPMSAPEIAFSLSSYLTVNLLPGFAEISETFNETPSSSIAIPTVPSIT
ncbi:Wzz/FepE/Etk N-terminal domain-containing protein, partial [Klebsiella pneumoniae]|uniref:Wzz/FepE/Etk N-terminal domain-containing protein n=1 Tax=Klebsiella pneumoniae TaxID=573 RepID=UPI00200EEF2B